MGKRCSTAVKKGLTPEKKQAQQTINFSDLYNLSTPIDASPLSGNGSEKMQCKRD